MNFFSRNEEYFAPSNLGYDLEEDDTEEVQLTEAENDAAEEHQGKLLTGMDQGITLVNDVIQI